jgi:hypothetical protein
MQENSRNLVEYLGQEGFQFIEELFLIVYNFSTALAKASLDNQKSAMVERRASTSVVPERSQSPEPDARPKTPSSSTGTTTNETSNSVTET